MNFNGFSMEYWITYSVERVRLDLHIDKNKSFKEIYILSTKHRVISITKPPKTLSIGSFKGDE